MNTKFYESYYGYKGETEIVLKEDFSNILLEFFKENYIDEHDN